MADVAVRIRLFLDVAPLMYCTRILVLLSTMTEESSFCENAKIVDIL